MGTKPRALLRGTRGVLADKVRAFKIQSPKRTLAALLNLIILLTVILCPPGAFGGDLGPDYTKTPVFFVHGHGMGPESFHAIISSLVQSGYPPRYLRAIQLVPNNGSNIEAAEKQIAPAVERFLNEINDFLKREKPRILPKKKIDIVSHSMGALSSRWYTTRVRSDRVSVWISLAGANHGTNVLCLFSDPGADDLCPAYAKNANESYIQFALNGNPKNREVDETPYGVGKDSMGVKTVPPDQQRIIIYFSIRTKPDQWIKPETSPILDGAGGATGFIESDLAAEEPSPGNVLMKKRTGHDEMLADDATISVVRMILERAGATLK